MKPLKRNNVDASIARPIIKTKKGITLVALVITIIVLLILAAITISLTIGEDGIITKAMQAKEQTEIANEKEIIKMAIMQETVDKKARKITQSGLQTELNKNTGEGQTEVSVDVEESLLFVKFVTSGRVYEVDANGNITYLGEENKLLDNIEINAMPESNANPELVQRVNFVIKMPMVVEEENTTLTYAWNQNEKEEPEESQYSEVNLAGTKRTEEVTISSHDTIEGDYYLWIKLKVREKEIIKQYGPYKIKDHTTLVSCASEGTEDSGFLGNTEIKRNEIEKVRIATSFEGHSLGDSNCWDVSQSQDGKYIAWYEDNDSNNYYEVTVAGNGGVVANSNSSNLFQSIGYNGEDIQVIYGIENLDTGLVTNMSNMFKNCRNMTSLDLKTFNTANVTNMGYMFYGCSKLSGLDVSNFNTANVTNMGYMFLECRNLSSLDVNNFNTDNVKNMTDMFYSCSNLNSLDVSQFNTANVTSMAGMFSECSNLSSLDVSQFNTTNVTNMVYMFSECSNLSSLDVSQFNTTNVTNMGYMFKGCSNLNSLDVSKFNTANVTNMASMFMGCGKLSSLDVSKWDTTNVTNMVNMFYGCRNLSGLDLKTFNTANVTNMTNMFYECSKLETLDISNFVIKEGTIYGEIIKDVATTVTIKANSDVAKLLKEKFPAYADNITTIN